VRRAGSREARGERARSERPTRSRYTTGTRAFTDRFRALANVVAPEVEVALPQAELSKPEVIRLGADLGDRPPSLASSSQDSSKTRPRGTSAASRCATAPDLLLHARPRATLRHVHPVPRAPRGVCERGRRGGGRRVRDVRSKGRDRLRIAGLFCRSLTLRMSSTDVLCAISFYCIVEHFSQNIEFVVDRGRGQSPTGAAPPQRFHEPSSLPTQLQLKNKKKPYGFSPSDL